MEIESKMWETNVLGEDTPDKLRDTVLYLLGVNCALRAGDEHYNLRRPGGCTSSQLSFELNEFGIRCLVYREDSVTKTNKGGLRDMKKERKIVWIKPNSDLTRCPVRIIEKYLNLLPLTGVKPNLYLQSLKWPRPNIWYNTVPVGINSIRKVVGSLLKDVGLDGYFTNHSLRRTCATRLFQAGEDVKLIKEVTGHISDAVTKYQETSDAQRMHVSSVIQGDVKPIKLSEAEPMEVVQDVKVPSIEDRCKLERLVLPIKTENRKELVENEQCASEVTNIIKSAVSAVGSWKAKLTIHVELLD